MNAGRVRVPVRTGREGFARPGTRKAGLVFSIAVGAIAACAVPDFKYPPSPPKIVRFVAAPFSLMKGDTTHISWEVTGADTVTLGGLSGGDRSVALAGMMDATAEENLELTLTATGPGGTTTAIAGVTVSNAQPVSIASFSADRDRIEPDQTVRVSWRTTNATRVIVRLSTGEILDGDAPKEGSRILKLQETTDVILHVEGLGGPLEQSLTIDVRALDPIIDVFRVTPRLIAPNSNALLVWNVEHATHATISRISAGGTTTILDGPLSSPSGSIAVDGRAGTSTLTIVAANAAGTAAASTILYVLQESAPEILDFTVTPTITGPGGDVLVRWSTAFASQVALDVGSSPAITDLPASGTRVITLSGGGPSASIDVRLRAMRGVSLATAIFTIALDANRPEITASASPDRILTGSTTTIAWGAQRADRVDFITDTGAPITTSTAASGMFTFAPPRSISVIVRATNSAGPTEKILSLLVGRAPIVDVFTASSTLARAGRSVDFAWHTQQAVRGAFFGSSFGNLDLGSRIVSGRARFAAGLSGTATVGITAESELFSAHRQTTIQVIGAAHGSFEAEPNDVPELANGLYTDPSVTVEGSLEPPDDVDMFSFSVPRGQRMRARVAPPGSCGGPMEIDLYDDSVRRVLGPPQAVVTGTGVQCPALGAEETAQVFPLAVVALRRAAMTSSASSYTLFVDFEPVRCGDGHLDYNEECDDGNTTPGDGCDAMCRLEGLDEGEPNDDPAHATIVEPNRALSCYLGLEDADDFQFTTLGGRASIVLEAPGPGSCRLDAAVALLRKSDGAQIAWDDGGGLGCPMINGVLLDPDVYVVDVRGGGGGPLPVRGAYRLTITAP